MYCRYIYLCCTPALTTQQLVQCFLFLFLFLFRFVCGQKTNLCDSDSLSWAGLGWAGLADKDQHHSPERGKPPEG